MWDPGGLVIYKNDFGLLLAPSKKVPIFTLNLLIHKAFGLERLNYCGNPKYKCFPTLSVKYVLEFRYVGITGCAHNRLGLKAVVRFDYR